MIDLGIVVVNYNTRERLHDCLKSLEESRDISFITYVVDNGSSDGSAAMVREAYPHIQLIESQVNGGYSYANNLAMRRILALVPVPPFILLLNPDTLLSHDTLVKMIVFLQKHPRAGIVGPKLIMADGTLDLACRRSFPDPTNALYHILKLDKRFPKSKRLARYNLTFLDENQEAEVDSVVGAFMMMRTEALGQAGLLDERYFMYGEDLDLALRFKKMGWKVYYYPAVQVLHYKREASRGSPKAQYEFWRAAYIFYHKHYQRETPFWLHGLMILGLTFKGGIKLVREMVHPLPPAPNRTELYT